MSTKFTPLEPGDSTPVSGQYLVIGPRGSHTGRQVTSEGSAPPADVPAGET